MNKCSKWLKIAQEVAATVLVLVFFCTTWSREPKDINYLEWIAVILCFILLKGDRK